MKYVVYALAFLLCMAACYWLGTASVPTDDPQRQQFVRRIDSLTADSRLNRERADSAVKVANYFRALADSIHYIPITHIEHEALTALRSADVDSLRNVLLTAP